MSKIFINYRTGDGDQLAAHLDGALRHRFGTDEVFRDGTSIRAGADYTQELMRAVRRCRVLLAVIGPHWSTAPQLHHEDDWVRREIIEAREYGIPVVPVLSGRSTERLCKEELPAELMWLADRQALAFTPYTSVPDLRRIGDQLAELVPGLTDVTVAAQAPSEQSGTHNSVGGSNHGTLVQGRDFSGDIAGAIYKNNSGPFHTGTGSQHIHHTQPRFEGDGGTFIAGSNNGGINHHYDKRRHTEDDER
ncbi:toll/interleukin-1 receptor domain-containing protein [Streptomyces sp. NPDC005865]|uniref:toll/interleukin-1 receptor domain-containing protein n=1 Tax=Streptomyces sp. NPDC005865 TaxID=3155453 RepID=UPI0034044AD8